MNAKTLVFGLKKSLLLAMGLLLVPMAALAKAPDSSYGYVSSVFEKLQSHWEEQAYAKQLTDSVLTFTLDEDGTLNNSGLDTGANTDSGRALLGYLKQSAPFGKFPQGLQGSQLQFKFKLTPGSMQMVGYQLMPKSDRESVVAFVNPVTTQQQPVSLFYTRVGMPAKVWDNPTKQASNEQSMSEYIAEVQQQIRGNWKLPQDYVFQRTIAVLMIDRDGTLLGANLKQSSGDKTVDKAAMDAIYSAGKFPKAPANVPSLPVTIEYIFEPVLSSAE